MQSAVERVLSDANKNRMVKMLCDASGCCCKKVKFRIKVQKSEEMESAIKWLEANGYGGIKKAYGKEKEFAFETDCKEHNEGNGKQKILK